MGIITRQERAKWAREQSQRLARKIELRGLPHFVYALTDPRTGHVRYVGLSHQPEIRFKAHVATVSRSTKQWVLELRSLGLKPDMLILCGPESQAVAAQSEAQCIIELGKVYPMLNQRYGRDEQEGLRYKRSVEGKLVRRLFNRMRSDLHFKAIHWAMERGILEGFRVEV